MQHYDPLVANGILPLSVSTMLEHGVPGATMSKPFIPPEINNAPSDTFVPNQEKKSGGWKKWAFAALLTTLAFFGLKKFGINPLKKITQSAKFQTVKNYVTEKLGKLNIKENIQKGINKVVDFFKKKPKTT